MAKRIPLLYENVFSKSPEKGLTATKIPTKFAWLSLLSEDTYTDYENKTLYVGTVVRVCAYLQYQKPDGTWTSLENKKALVHFFHKLDTGAWEDLGTGDTPRSASIYEKLYTLAKAGAHRFYAEFPGDDTYEGCKKAVRAFAKRSVR
jgi:hypothetical protein